LNRYVAAYCEENDTDDAVITVARDGDIRAYRSLNACWAAFDRPHVDLDGEQIKRRVHFAVSNWHAYLVCRKYDVMNSAEASTTILSD
jgi:hypothetical protein